MSYCARYEEREVHVYFPCLALNRTALRLEFLPLPLEIWLGLMA